MTGIKLLFSIAGFLLFCYTDTIIKMSEREETMAVKILDDTITFEAFADHEDAGFEDDICLRFTETCPEEEKVFYGGENNLYVTREQARRIATEILIALED